MAQILVRGLSQAAVDNLKARARSHHRSLEAEVREMIEREAARAPVDRAALLERAAQLRRELEGRWTGDSADLIREDRER